MWISVHGVFEAEDVEWEGSGHVEKSQPKYKGWSKSPYSLEGSAQEICEGKNLSYSRQAHSLYNPLWFCLDIWIVNLYMGFSHWENIDSQSYAHFPNIGIFHIECQHSLKSPMLKSEKTSKLYKAAKLTLADVISYIWCFLESSKFIISHIAVSSFFEGTGWLCSFF